jgi:glycosyltransferase involved in cell wall biosynthesis
MRILHIDGGRRWGGGQNQVRLLVRELAKRAEVEQTCLCPSGSLLAERLRDEGRDVETIPWEHGTDLKAFRAIARRVRAFDILHCHDGHAFQLAMIPAKLRRRPLVAARRVCFTTRPLKWNQATRVVAISDAVRTLLIESGVREDRIRVVPSGIDPAEVVALQPLDPPLRERLGIKSRQFLAGTVGTLLEYKNQTLIPQAAARLRDVHWVIVGEGPQRAVIQNAITAHGVGAHVQLPGNIADARRSLREFDVFVFTSQGEALGTSILDAMAAGVPVVAADDAGPAEILRPVHARTGANLYPPGDPDALAALVRRVRDEPTLAPLMASLQRERIVDYHIAKTAEGTLGVYREVMRRP